MGRSTEHQEISVRTESQIIRAFIGQLEQRKKLGDATRDPSMDELLRNGIEPLRTVIDRIEPAFRQKDSVLSNKSDDKGDSQFQ